MNRIWLFLCFLIPLPTFAQSSVTTLYHSYRSSTSDFHITEWNISKQQAFEGKGQFVEEIIDSKGRVQSIKFHFKGELVSNPLCHLASWINFEYPNDSTIVVTQFRSTGDYGGSIECDNPTRITYYHNSESFRLISAETEMIMSKETRQLYFEETSAEKLDQLIEEMDVVHKNPEYIKWFQYSYAKRDGVYPVGSDITMKQLFSKLSLLSEYEKNRIQQTWPTRFAH